MTKAIVRMRSVKMLFWLIIQNSQERTCAGVIFNMRLQRLQPRCFPMNNVILSRNADRKNHIMFPKKTVDFPKELKKEEPIQSNQNIF